MSILDMLFPYDIVMFIISLLCIIFIKKEKLLLSLPLTINFFFLSYYNFMDSLLFERAHRMSPYGGTYNFDYTRLIISFIMVLFMLFLSIFLSKKISGRRNKIIYIVSIFIFNITLAYITYFFHRILWIT